VIHRKKYFIDKSFQSKFIIKFLSIVIISSLIFMVSIIYFSRNASMVTITNTKVSVKTYSDFILPIASIVFFIVLLFSSFAVLILSLTTSHKISGPLDRFVKEINLLAKGDLKRNFSIRDNDQLRAISSSLENMSARLCEKQTKIQKAFSSLRSFMVSKDFCPSNKDVDECVKRIKEVQTSLNEFKI
jgi:methyl-accepting chemotaxis protein